METYMRGRKLWTVDDILNSILWYHNNEKAPEEKDADNQGSQPGYTLEPSNSPSMPQTLPSTSVSSNPTSVPSLLSTQKPSFMFSTMPSNAPSAFPSRQMSLSPSIQNIAIPTYSPSSFPATMPSSSLFTFPPTLLPSSLTYPPSVNPLPPPTKYLCDTTIHLDGTENIQSIIITYSYEVETDPIISTDIISIIRAVEDAINDALTSLLIEFCQDNRSLLGELHRFQKGRVLETVGLSVHPSDHPQDQECQSEIKHENNDCTVVDGGLMLFNDGLIVDLKAIIIGAIQADMDDGRFVKAHRAIVGITLKDNGPVTIEDNGLPTTKDVDIDDNIRVKEVLQYHWIALTFSLVALAVTLLATAGILRRYLKKKKEKMKPDPDPDIFDLKGEEAAR
mmetsp:Transcript_2157/g.3108  ORF Transcript_2157/g.3108 Transcript_2157/m.3108 type:complete len:393 (+) Transcript_2157:86-1264(+)